MATVHWTNSAVEDLDAIVRYIAKDSVNYAERFEVGVVAAPKRLERFPASRQIVPEFGKSDIREVLYGAYRIIYQIRGDTCNVVAVVHGSRDLAKHVDKF